MSHYKVKGDLKASAHPIADAFPMMPVEGIENLAKSIKTNGQKAPVLLQKTPKGKVLVLDGRNRLRACEMVGVEPMVSYVESSESVLELILSFNADRRHQSTSQRALAAARLANILRPGRPSGIASKEAISQSEAAQRLHVSRAAVQRAAAMLEDRILAPAVQAGKVKIGDAYKFRHSPDDAKRKALKAIDEGRASTLGATLASQAADRLEAKAASAGPDEPRPAVSSEAANPVSGSSDVAEPPEASAPSSSGPDAPTQDELLGLQTAVAGDVDRQGANGAVVARTDPGADGDLRDCLLKLGGIVERLGSDGEIQRGGPRFRAACRLALTLVSRMEQCLDADMNDDVLVAGLPDHVLSSLNS